MKVRTILEEADIKPNKIAYNCENRDPDFDQKIHNVLLVYKQLSLQFNEYGQLLPLQRIGMVKWFTCSPTMRSLEFRQQPIPQRTCSLTKTTEPSARIVSINALVFLARIDLQTDEAIPLVRDRHSSKEYVEFLSLLDDKYPKGDKIRLVLDNLRVHTFEETRKYLAKVPGRFEFVFTPKHGFWLNLVEGFFGKLTRQFLKGIRVKTKEELVERIYKYFDEVNAEPVVCQWKYKLDEINSDEKIQVETLPLKSPVNS